MEKLLIFHEQNTPIIAYRKRQRKYPVTDNKEGSETP